MRRPGYEQYSLAIAWMMLARRNSGASAQNDDSSAGSTSTSTEIFLDYPDCAGYRPHINDSYCDDANNNAECAYDGGDCCACTCVDSLLRTCGEVGGGYDCRDPDVADDCGVTPSPAASFGYPDCTGAMYNFQNGICNDDINSSECGYDGGDCCRCTCRDYTQYDYCGTYGFDCQDPGARHDCVSATVSPTPSPTGAYSEYYYYVTSPSVYDDDACAGREYSATGFCTATYNTPECDYDGGDCCECTCVDNDYACGTNGYDCLDPFASCFTSTPASSSTTTPSTPSTDDYYGSSSSENDDDGCSDRRFIGSGYCSPAYNTPECDYDGGDCCECTCVDNDYTCGTNGYACIDPSVDCAAFTPSPTKDDTSHYTDCSWGVYIGDGLCDSNSNTVACGYDGGDCCECTCVTSEYECGSGGYNCLDPTCTSRSIDDGGIDSEATSTESSLASSLEDRVVIGIIVASIFAFCCFGGIIIAGLTVITNKSLISRTNNALPEVSPTASRPSERNSLPPSGRATEESKDVEAAVSLESSTSAQVSDNDRRIMAAMIERSKREQTISESLYQKSSRLRPVIERSEASAAGVAAVVSEDGENVGNGEECKGFELEDDNDDRSVWSGDEDSVSNEVGSTPLEQGGAVRANANKGVENGFDEESSQLISTNVDPPQPERVGGTAGVEDGKDSQVSSAMKVKE